jgi:dipeptidyl-peptidase-4
VGQEDHHYPFAGCGNPKVRLGVVSTAGGEVRWFDLEKSYGPDFYLPRVKWLPDNTLVVQVRVSSARAFAAQPAPRPRPARPPRRCLTRVGCGGQVQNRAQTAVEVLHIWPQTGERKVLLEERSDAWVNLHKMFTPLKQSPRFLWASERTGFQHLYVYDYAGQLERQLTSGDWMVEEVKAVDEQAGLVYFMGTRSGWLERHLYSVPLGGGDVVQITREPGVHNVIFDHRNGRFVDQYSSAELPFRVNVCDAKDGAVVRALFANNDARLPRLALAPPQFATFPSLDGRVTLQAAVLRPDPAKFGPGPYPTVVPVYGGPHVQTVSNSWTVTADLRSQFLCSQGYLVLKIDNRGSARRGLGFESEVRWDMGNLEVQDQKAGVQWAAAQGLADPSALPARPAAAAPRPARSDPMPGGAPAELRETLTWAVRARAGRARRHLRVELRWVHGRHGARARTGRVPGRRRGRPGHELGRL